MTYVIAETCIDVKDGVCTDVCPVDSIYEGGRMYYIQPDECVNCALCVSVCPVEAIWTRDLPDRRHSGVGDATRRRLPAHPVQWRRAARLAAGAAEPARRAGSRGRRAHRDRQAAPQTTATGGLSADIRSREKIATKIHESWRRECSGGFDTADLMAGGRVAGDAGLATLNAFCCSLISRHPELSSTGTIGQLRKADVPILQVTFMEGVR